MFRLDWLPELIPRYNVAPTQDVPVVRLRENGRRELAMLRWGLIPQSPKQSAIGHQSINGDDHHHGGNTRVWPIHERMPAIVAPADHERWLGADGPAEVQDVLRPYPPSMITAYRVSSAVDDVQNDARECVARI